jgi:uncharacterized SAM-binding protein YcdF (DUF218 family)
MRRSNKWLLYASGFFVGILLVGTVVIGSAGYWLSANDKLIASDAIVILAGGVPERALYAGDLFCKGYSSHVYISRGAQGHSRSLLDDLGIHLPLAEEINRQVLLYKKVPHQNISIFGKGSISTAEEAHALNQMLGTDKQRIIVVTSPYHVKRARMILTDVMAGYEISVVGTPYDSFQKQWWKDQDSARNVMLEITKIFFYVLGGRFYSGGDL